MRSLAPCSEQQLTYISPLIFSFFDFLLRPIIIFVYLMIWSTNYSSYDMGHVPVIAPSFSPFLAACSRSTLTACLSKLQTLHETPLPPLTSDTSLFDIILSVVPPFSFRLSSLAAALSPYKQKAMKGVFSGYLFNGFSRLAGQMPFWIVPFGIGTSVSLHCLTKR